MVAPDEHLLFFLWNSLKETITVGTEWMIQTAPWEDIMKNPPWPADIQSSSGRSVQTGILDKTLKEMDVSDEGWTDIDELEDNHVEFPDVEVEEDEVDHLVNMME